MYRDDGLANVDKLPGQSTKPNFKSNDRLSTENLHLAIYISKHIYLAKCEFIIIIKYIQLAEY